VRTEGLIGNGNSRFSRKTAWLLLITTSLLPLIELLRQQTLLPKLKIRVRKHFLEYKERELLYLSLAT
jgi:hypothetical protein